MQKEFKVGNYVKITTLRDTGNNNFNYNKTLNKIGKIISIISVGTEKKYIVCFDDFLKYFCYFIDEIKLYNKDTEKHCSKKC